MQCNYLFKDKIKQLRIDGSKWACNCLFILVIELLFILFSFEILIYFCIGFNLIWLTGLISTCIIKRILNLIILTIFKLIDNQYELLLNKLNTLFILVYVVALSIHYLLQEKVYVIFLIFVKWNDLFLHLTIAVLFWSCIFWSSLPSITRHTLRPSLNNFLPLCWWLLNLLDLLIKIIWRSIRINYVLLLSLNFFNQNILVILHFLLLKCTIYSVCSLHFDWLWNLKTLRIFLISYGCQWSTKDFL